MRIAVAQQATDTRVLQCRRSDPEFDVDTEGACQLRGLKALDIRLISGTRGPTLAKIGELHHTRSRHHKRKEFNALSDRNGDARSVQELWLLLVRQLHLGLGLLNPG